MITHLKMGWVILTVGCLCFGQSISAATQKKSSLELFSAPIPVGFQLAESERRIYSVRLTAQVDEKGEGHGMLELDPNVPEFDEFGSPRVPSALPTVKIECTVKFEKKGRVQIEAGPPPEEWQLFRLSGAKITTALFIATRRGLSSGRFLVGDEGHKVRFAVDVRTPSPPLPCHPGCFPAGTAIRVPEGTRPVEAIRVGDIVTTIDASGVATRSKVAAVFVSRNPLVKVKVEDGILETTETQPLCLVSGDLSTSLELKVGDQIWRWHNGARKVGAVVSVELSGREAVVYNLVIGKREIFVAGDFLVRSKPPTDATPINQ